MDFNKLNCEQLKAATFSGKHLLVLAGAGTGKTRTLIARAIYLINNDISPKRIKILSFTKKSAQEIVERIKIESSDNPKAKDLSGSTFHSWCMELITRFPSDFNLKGFTILDDDDQLNAFKLIIGRISGKKSIVLNNKLKITPALALDIYSYTVNTRKKLTESIYLKLDVDDFSQENIDKIHHVLKRIIEEYVAYKNSHHYIDYDDMLFRVAIALKKDFLLRNRISSLYDHILIDEMQDTNPLQWMLLESFYSKCNLFCVGDDAQSIFAFRGADFKSIHLFEEKVPDSHVYRLIQNYRSTQEILDISNWMINKSPLKYNKNLIAFRGKGEKPVAFFVSSQFEEANIITDIILEGVANGKKFRDYLILSRYAYLWRVIEGACIKKGIPYVTFGGTKLMKAAHVRDVISVLRIVSNQFDELAWTRYLTLWPGIGEVTAAKIIDNIFKATDLKSAISCVKKEICDPFSPVAEILNKALFFSKDPSMAIDVTVEEMTDLLSSKYDHWDFRKKDFEILKYVAAKCADIPSFIAEYIIDPVAEQTHKTEEDKNNDIITISTIHSAKGLEADTCFIINISPTSYPSAKAVDIDEIEEERRCLYVALTRPKNHLYLMFQKASVTTEQVSDVSEKFFFNDLPLELYNGINNRKPKYTSSETTKQILEQIDLS